MKVTCLDCGVSAAFRNREEAIDKGWMGVGTQTGRIDIGFQLCPEHNSPERIVEIHLDKLGFGGAE